MKGLKNNIIIKSIILFAFIAVGVVFIFMKVIDIKNEQALTEDFPTTEYDLLAARDMDAAYPATTSEVLKLYNKYLKYIYNTKMEEDEFECLVDKVRCMWSEEWLKLNERESHITNFRSEVEKFMEDGKVMSNYLVEDSTSAKNFVTPDGVEGRVLMCSYLYTEKGSTSKVFLQYYFLLEDGKWKILYYEPVDNLKEDSVTDEGQ